MNSKGGGTREGEKKKGREQKQGNNIIDKPEVTALIVMFPNGNCNCIQP